jgi:hypothetical protein
LLAPTSKADRLTTANAEEMASIIRNALLIYRSRHKTRNCRNVMGSKNYAHQLNTMVIPKLPPNTVVVTDNASCHKIQIDKPPALNSEKDKMKAWLLERNLASCDSMCDDNCMI